MTSHIPKKPLSQSGDLYRELSRDVSGFLNLAAILKKMAGINLPQNDKNLSLMASRVIPIMRDHGLTDYEELQALIEKDRSGAAHEFVERLTTNTTSFFREEGHFPVFQRVLKERAKIAEQAGRRELRLWCAAASTGQEPYTIAMTALEALAAHSTVALRILATDIDKIALTKASRGIYTEDEVSRVPHTLRSIYFTEHATKAGKRFVAKDHLKNVLTFAPLNLVEVPYAFRFEFDIIMCRNVLIYFDQDTVAGIVGRMDKALFKGGYLFLGHAETSARRPQGLNAISHAVYQKS
ncbi:MAG: protein-glutamate O-methyltransferase CheR [Proteobacteria bacterium]|nr:MAG: protein-glutamate O-methyltransferase CheR [Pseudomonadota bacterium]